MWNKKGFTLVEIMVVTAIFLVVSIITADIIINSLKSIRFESELAAAVENARKSMNAMTKEIRGANTSEKGDYPLAVAQENELIFFNDINNDDLMEKIRYYLNGTNLIREVYLPGALQNYSVLNSTETIAMHINNNNIPIYTYYDSNYAVAAAINQIRMIKIQIIININPAAAPNNYVLESDVSFRNLKDN